MTLLAKKPSSKYPNMSTAEHMWLAGEKAKGTFGQDKSMGVLATEYVQGKKKTGKSLWGAMGMTAPTPGISEAPATYHSMLGS